MLFTVLAGLMLFMTTNIHGESSKKIAARQELERKEFLERLTKDYGRLDELWQKAKARPAGVTVTVMNAIQNGYIYDGQPVAELEPMFGRNNLIQFKRKSLRIIVVRLEYHDDGIKEPHSQGFQWHIVAGVSDANKIENLSLQYTSMKWLMMKGDEQTEK